MKYEVASLFTFNGKKHEIGEVIDKNNIDIAGIEFLVSQGRLYPIVDVKEPAADPAAEEIVSVTEDVTADPEEIVSVTEDLVEAFEEDAVPEDITEETGNKKVAAEEVKSKKSRKKNK